jgi:hypothetical protein
MVGTRRRRSLTVPDEKVASARRAFETKEPKDKDKPKARRSKSVDNTETCDGKRLSDNDGGEINTKLNLQAPKSDHETKPVDEETVLDLDSAAVACGHAQVVVPSETKLSSMTDQKDRRSNSNGASTEEAQDTPETSIKDKKSGSVQQSRSAKMHAAGPKPRNALSKLIPGYLAPLELAAPSLDKFRAVGGLDELRRKAVLADPVLRKTAFTPRMPLSAPSSSACASSVKKGVKRVVREDAGDGWFGMRPTPLTDELKQDLTLIRNRNYLDPKRFYKSSDPTGKVVQLGTVIEGAAEYYSSRLTKKQRRNNLVDEIMADPKSSDYAKHKYKKMQQEKTDLAMKQQRRHKRKGKS